MRATGGRYAATAFAAALLATAGLSCPSTLLAQSASEITPHSFAPPIESNREGGFSLGETQQLDTPAGAENLFVTLSSVSFSTELPELAQAGAAVRNRLVGRRVSGAEIFAAARELETVYARAGYVLVRVVLPPQTLVDGSELRFTVIDGYIERIETHGVPAPVRARIAALVAPLTGKHALKLHDIERRILLASDTSGVVLRSTLAPGAETGAAVLVIEAKYHPVDGTLTGDNSLARSLGADQLGLGLDLNSVARLGELAYVRANGDPGNGSDDFLGERPRNRTLAAGVILPIGIEGFTGNLEGTRAHTTPAESDGTQSSDVFERLSLRARYPWIRSRDFNVASQIIFDAENERETLVLPTDVPLFDDRVRLLRALQEVNGVNRVGGSWSAGLTASYGFDALGARSAAKASAALPLSRQGEQANFTTLQATASYTQGLAAHLSTQVTARGQYAFGRSLARAEEIGIADPDSLSAFDQGSVQGDSGFVMRGELSSPWLLPLRTTRLGVLASPYVFGALGSVFVADPTALEAAHVHAGSFGGGLRLGGSATGGFSTVSLNLEGARETGGGTHDVSRFRLSVAMKF
jgi:hemolysin activation/secretion protein